MIKIRMKSTTSIAQLALGAFENIHIFPIPEPPSWLRMVSFKRRLETIFLPKSFQRIALGNKGDKDKNPYNALQSTGWSPFLKLHFPPCSSFFIILLVLPLASLTLYLYITNLSAENILPFFIYPVHSFKLQHIFVLIQTFSNIHKYFKPSLT